MNKTTIPKFLKPFTFHGIITPAEVSASSGDELSTDCPFCTKGDGHFSIALKEKERVGGVTMPGMWNCLRCGEGGGILTLLHLLYEYSVNQAQSLAPLAKQRSLREDTLMDHGVCEHPLIPNTYMFPVFDEDGSVQNIYKYDLSKEKPLLLGTPGRTTILYGLDTLSNPIPGNDLEGKELAAVRKDYPLWVCEGHHDRLAVHESLIDKDTRHTCDILGVPGANSFRPEWCRHLSGRPVILCFDYDVPKEENGKVRQAGKDGIDRTVRIISRSEFKPQNLYIVDWRKK